MSETPENPAIKDQKELKKKPSRVLKTLLVSLISVASLTAIPTAIFGAQYLRYKGVREHFEGLVYEKQALEELDSVIDSLTPKPAYPNPIEAQRQTEGIAAKAFPATIEISDKLGGLIDALRQRNASLSRVGPETESQYSDIAQQINQLEQQLSSTENSLESIKDQLEGVRFLLQDKTIYGNLDQASVSGNFALQKLKMARRHGRTSLDKLFMELPASHYQGNFIDATQQLLAIIDFNNSYAKHFEGATISYVTIKGFAKDIYSRLWFDLQQSGRSFDLDSDEIYFHLYKAVRQVEVNGLPAAILLGIFGAATMGTLALKIAAPNVKIGIKDDLISFSRLVSCLNNAEWTREIPDFEANLERALSISALTDEPDDAKCRRAVAEQYLSKITTIGNNQNWRKWADRAISLAPSLRPKAAAIYLSLAEKANDASIGEFFDAAVEYGASKEKLIAFCIDRAWKTKDDAISIEYAERAIKLGAPKKEISELYFERGKNTPDLIAKLGYFSNAADLGYRASALISLEETIRQLGSENPDIKKVEASIAKIRDRFTPDDLNQYEILVKGSKS